MKKPPVQEARHDWGEIRAGKPRAKDFSFFCEQSGRILRQS
jgi:hypothetical protein